MSAAVDELAPPDDVATALRDYFSMAADAMVNQPD
jgi:truncated hemoglobin YjbI